MVTSDLFVGFRGKPQGLEAFLDENGYELVNDEANHKVFEPKSDVDIIDITLFYHPDSVIKEDDENYEDYYWKAYPDVTSTLNISFDPIPRGEEAIRIAELVTKKFNGVYYDPGLELYFEARDL